MGFSYSFFAGHPHINTTGTGESVFGKNLCFWGAGRQVHQKQFFRENVFDMSAFKIQAATMIFRLFILIFCRASAAKHHRPWGQRFWKKLKFLSGLFFVPIHKLGHSSAPTPATGLRSCMRFPLTGISVLKAPDNEKYIKRSKISAEIPDRGPRDVGFFLFFPTH